MINGGQLILSLQVPFRIQFLSKGCCFKLVPLSSFPVMDYEMGTSSGVLWSCSSHDTPSTKCFLWLCSSSLMLNFSSPSVPNFLPSSLLGPDQKVWLLCAFLQLVSRPLMGPDRVPLQIWVIGDKRKQDQEVSEASSFYSPCCSSLPLLATKLDPTTIEPKQHCRGLETRLGSVLHASALPGSFIIGWVQTAQWTRQWLHLHNRLSAYGLTHKANLAYEFYCIGLAWAQTVG